MNAQREWFVEGSDRNEWIAARDADEACETYVARYQLPRYVLDLLIVTNVRAER